MRVGADSAIGAKYAARGDSRVLGMLGSGGMARSHLAALLTVRPLERVQVYSPTKVNRERYAAEMSELHGVEVVPVDEPRDVFRGADIVSGCTDAAWRRRRRGLAGARDARDLDRRRPRRPRPRGPRRAAATGHRTGADQRPLLAAHRRVPDLRRPPTGPGLGPPPAREEPSSPGIRPPGGQPGGGADRCGHGSRRRPGHHVPRTGQHPGRAVLRRRRPGVRAGAGADWVRNCRRRGFLQDVRD
jgi:Ornithine cyclodeaminase/mu-crystallin family